MRTLMIAAAVAMIAAGASAHTYSESGNITLLTEDQVGLGLGSLIESTAPGTIPNGLIWYVVNGVVGSDSFTITADDGQTPQAIGTADECPGPDTFAPDDPDWWLNDFWVTCNLIPDFDVYFTGGQYTNGPGDEGGVVPGDGAAVVVLYEGDVGEGFTYFEEA